MVCVLRSSSWRWYSLAARTDRDLWACVVLGHREGASGSWFLQRHLFSSASSALTRSRIGSQKSVKWDLCPLFFWHISPDVESVPLVGNGQKTVVADHLSQLLDWCYVSGMLGVGVWSRLPVKNCWQTIGEYSLIIVETKGRNTDKMLCRALRSCNSWKRASCANKLSLMTYFFMSLRLMNPLQSWSSCSLSSTRVL